jgi:hypothetical protein
MKTIIYIAGALLTLTMLYDMYIVYITTHEINQLITINVNTLKAKSVVGLYVQAPHIQDPFEAIWTLVEKFAFCWFIVFSYSFLSVMYIIRSPLIFYRNVLFI